jgi:hypothetical protein
VRITSLALTDLRRYRDQEFELAPGLTIVRGPNEAGKTTIQRAIELALTRKCTSSAADLDGLVAWDADADARTAIAMTFTYEDEDGDTKEGRLAKSFRGPKGQVRLELNGEPITDPARADEELAALSGVPTEGFYRSTASVRHHELAGLQRDEAALRDRLRPRSAARTGDGSRQAQAGPRDPRPPDAGRQNQGRLKVSEDAFTDAAAKLQAGEDALQRLEHDRDALAVARERRAEADTALAERRSMLEKARQAERLTVERDAAQERFERYRTAVAVRDEIAELERTHPSPTPLPVLRSSVERLRSVDTKIATLRSMLEGEIQVSFEVPPEVRWQPMSRWALVLVGIGIVIAVASFLLGFLGILQLTAGVAIGGFVAAIGAVLAFVGWWLRHGDRIEKQLQDVEVDRRLRGRSDLGRSCASRRPSTTTSCSGWA